MDISPSLVDISPSLVDMCPGTTHLTLYTHNFLPVKTTTERADLNTAEYGTLMGYLKFFNAIYVHRFSKSHLE